MDPNRTPAGLTKRNLERKSAEEFWTEKGDFLRFVGTKAVFEQYKVFCQINSLPILNEYIFRTYIRKRGYGKEKLRGQTL